jgi:25S rRNA (uracil2843-N3)-methyltransferase
LGVRFGRRLVRWFIWWVVLERRGSEIGNVSEWYVVILGRWELRSRMTMLRIEHADLLQFLEGDVTNNYHFSLAMAPPKAKVRADKKPAQRPQKESKRNAKTQQESTTTIPLDLQQLLLNIFKDSFSERFETDIKPLLQEIKGHLYNRDFGAAFGKEEYLEAYAARWSPSRALGYLQLLESLGRELQPFSEKDEVWEDTRWKVVCLGGGAGAEIVALGGFLKWLDMTVEEEHGRDLSVVAIDIADWTNVVENLTQHIIAKPPTSKYASAAARAARAPLVDKACLNVSFHQYDMLNTPFATLSPLLQGANFVTLMFTLNELYSTSLSLTQQFLLNLTSSLRPGSILLVVDSPGSYSTVTLNGTEKKYPMQWLLDHTLLEEKRGAEPQWEKIEEDESKWFRMDERLTYPIELENMRFQLHLYRRLG